MPRRTRSTCEQALTVVEPRLGERHAQNVRSAVEDPRNRTRAPISQVAVDDVTREPDVSRVMDERDRALVRVVLALVFGEVSCSLGGVLDVEASLAASVESGDELVEPRPSRDDDDAVVHLPTLALPVRRRPCGNGRWR